ncbi:hypothetical protein CHGG_00961 [Chaetomium globosum CBS 148.51]|uniref:F-box domain-containing protein n=1 Tax=Chaetomium globosum (strain ATCC 6205 / CBS 148.51 / DSM 1962 / NBRC 6347 / NRRL 1970) TaxID=306901 RepID=Q2HFP3_CHAGB|nr:uncharacterized protein CHGG_00961 [Chaetomium globosum CBS 148.51]EAQ92726.1 hypothetical protein CHGG_00961 [Chaetomium globosum CBS 148.51]
MTDHDVVTGVVADTSEGRRPSIEKAPIIITEVDDGLDDSEPPAFERLPDEIIQQILQVTDANGFASLALLNSKWRSVAQQAHLYAHHLASCPSYAMSHGAPPQVTSDDDLPRLRRLFAREVKRNLFEAYLRPNQTVIKVISNSISSSSCPGGEGIQFSPSPKGHHLLAYNSSRIHVIDLRTPEIAVKREFKILRRPAATCINDEGTTLAVLLTEMEVDIYDLNQTPPKRTHSMILDHSPRAIALSPCGSVLAAAYEGGIEVSSINPGALATDRRAVKCDGNGKYEEAAWTFTYDRSFETFRAVRIDDLRNGTTYFTGPVPSPNSQARLIPCTLPAASYSGDLVSAGFQGKEIWLYGVPEDLDAVPEPPNVSVENGSNVNGLSRHSSGPSVRSSIRIQENSDSVRVPQWQILCDKLRNTFVAGSKIGELEGINTVKFVADFADSSVKERLLVAARGVAPNISVTDEEGIDFVDGGRITIMDFDYSVTNGTTTECTIEVGTEEGPEVLEEEHRDMATEVAIVRRRTVAQNRGSRHAVAMRSATTAARPPPLPSQSPTQPDGDEDDPLVPRRIGSGPHQNVEPTAAGEETESQTIEEQEALDAPYAHASPRSGTTLRRAATAAANNRRLHPSATTSGHIVYRRADGRAEHPHESDADNWVPPPPPYQKDDPGDLPSFLRHTSILPPTGSGTAPAGEGAEQSADRKAMRNSSASMHQQHRRAQTVASANRFSSPVPPVPPLPSLSNMPPVPPVPALPPGVTASPLAPLPQAHAHERGRGLAAPSSNEDPARPASRASRYLEGENIYDVSPPDSPALAPVGRHVSREASDTRAASNPEQPSQTSMVPPSSPPTTIGGESVTTGRTQTASVSPEGGDPATLVVQPAIQVPSDPIPPMNDVPTADDPLVRRISVSRTWPIQPVPINTNNSTVGYPYSAPPVNNNEMLSQSFPLPGNEQDPAFNNLAPTSRPLSGSFPLPGTATDGHAGGEQNWRRTSTPKGVSGAFDPPERHPSDRRAETPILSPIPRHPRPQTQASILRPPPQEHPQPQQPQHHHLQPQQQHPYQHHQQLQPPDHRLAPIYNSPPNLAPGALLTVPPPPGSASTSFSRRVPSLSRKQSRAERSAAKNVADAKKRGWSGRSTRGKSRKGRKKKGEPDFDVQSTAAWTDVTVTAYSVRSAFGVGNRRGGGGGVVDGMDVAGVKDKKGRDSGTWGGDERVWAGGPSVVAMGLPRLELVAMVWGWVVFGPRPTGPWPLSAITVNFDPSRAAAAELKRAAISRVENWLALGPRFGHPPPRDTYHSGAVILVSQSLAGWLHDDAFVARMLTASGMTSGQGEEISVLAAAVDQVPAYDRRIDAFSSSEGISVLRGETSKLLPSSFEPELATEADSRPSLLFQRSPANLAELAVHVPLAKTLFSSGSPTTLVESRWLANTHQPPRLTQKLNRTSQTVVLPIEDLQFEAPNPLTTVRPHLVPVTSPALVLRSLGNILSQIEVDGRPSPPSQQLEYIIPKLLRAPRRLRDDSSHDEAHIAVWALVMPPSRTTRYLDPLTPLPVDRYDPDVEWALARDTAKKLDPLLISGCRLHKVVSGGGGWGAKQGLLSLDPETQLATDEHHTLNNFKESFFQDPNYHGTPLDLPRLQSRRPHGLGNPGPAHSLIPPGSLVQFFVEAAYPTPSQALAAWSRDWDPAESSATITGAFGTPGAVIDPCPVNPVTDHPSLFGAVSATGVFLSRGPMRGLPEIAAKLDSPRSYFVARANPGRVQRV